MSASLGDAETLRRIARARASEATAPCLEALPFNEFASLLRERSGLGDAPFLIYRDGALRSELSYAELAARVGARMAALRRLGVGRGDRVATLLQNHPEVPVTAFAVWALGATLVPVSLGEDDDRIGFVLENSRAAVALYLPEVAERAEALSARAAGLPFHPVDSEGEAPEPLVAALAASEPPSAEDEALIVYTSGTTGAPKGVVLEQRNLLVDAQALGEWNGIDADSRTMCVLPTHHVNGLIVTLVAPLLAGASTVLCRAFKTSDFWRTIEQERVHVVSVVPTLLAFLLEDPDAFRGCDLGAFRHLICGAGPLTVELALRFEDHFGYRVLHGYGLSETTCYSCMLPTSLGDEEHAGWMREHGFPSIGVPLPPNEMAIHDEQGEPVPEGERGEIVIRGVNVMKGYYQRPEANAETFAHGWFRSGDEGFLRTDAQGRSFFFITGRMKELIIRGGVNLSPLEIDEVLNRVPGVARGLAVGFENQWYGEEVGAYVMAEEGVDLDAEDVLAACREELPFAKSPKVVVFGDDVPVTSTGKYQRGRLRPLFAEWRDTQFRK